MSNSNQDETGQLNVYYQHKQKIDLLISIFIDVLTVIVQNSLIHHVTFIYNVLAETTLNNLDQ